MSQQTTTVHVGDYVSELSFERISREGIPTCLVQESESGDEKVVVPETSSHH